MVGNLNSSLSALSVGSNKSFPKFSCFIGYFATDIPIDLPRKWLLLTEVCRMHRHNIIFFLAQQCNIIRRYIERVLFHAY